MASNSKTIGSNYTLYVGFTESEPSTANNTSKISCTGYLKANGTYWSTSYQSTLEVYWHDDKNNSDVLVARSSFYGMTSSTDQKNVSGEITVEHKTDGSLSGYAWVNFIKGSTTSVYAPPSSSCSTVWTTLTKIDRYATMISATNFNDTENPSFTYNNPRNLEMTAWLELNPVGTHYAIRTVTGTSGTYTWTLTSAERNQLRNALPNSNTAVCRIGIQSTIDGVTYSSYKDMTYTIVDANPTFTHAEVETSSTVISVLGTSSASSVIQNASVIDITITPTALKGASITSVKLNSGNYSETITTSPYVFSVPVTQQSFAVVVTDSRGNANASVFTKTMIEYYPISFNSFSFERDNPTSSDIILNLEANYYQQTFDSTPNMPTVRWKLDDGTFNTISSTEYTIDTTNNTLTITNYELTNTLVYTSKGTFTLEFSDLLTSFSDTQDVIKGIPTFDYGEHDLKVNGQLYIADEDGENAVNVGDRITGTILWENQSPNVDFISQSITLSSDEYDMLEVIAKIWTSYNYQKYFSIRFPKGQSGILSAMFVSDTTTMDVYFGQRVLDYVSDTSYTVQNAYGLNAGGTSAIQNNSTLIPLYVIGYNTGLF